MSYLPSDFEVIFRAFSTNRCVGGNDTNALSQRTARMYSSMLDCPSNQDNFRDLYLLLYKGSQNPTCSIGNPLGIEFCQL